MKIVIFDDSQGSNAWTFIRKGWARAFDLSGHEVYLADTHKQASLDVIDDFKPDLVMAQSYNLERGIIKALSENPQIKVVFQAGDWSDWSNSIDSDKYPILKASNTEVSNIKTLQKNRKVDLISAHYHQNNIAKTHGLWNQNLGIDIVGLPPALDVIDYVEGMKMPEFECDIVHISGYWGYKSQVLNEWFLPLMADSSLKVKVFGNRPWPGPSYCGTLDQFWVKHAFKSAKLNINLGEPHSQWDDGVEVNEKVFKLLGGKNVVLSDYEGSLYNDFFKTGEIEFAKNPQEFQEKARAIVAGDLTVDPQPGYNLVMAEHTYFNRVEALFRALGLVDEADKVVEKFNELRAVNGI